MLLSDILSYSSHDYFASQNKVIQPVIHTIWHKIFKFYSFTTAGKIIKLKSVNF